AGPDFPHRGGPCVGGWQAPWQARPWEWYVFDDRHFEARRFGAFNVYREKAQSSEWGKIAHNFAQFGRAMGGPIQASFPYLVGERGPELVVPRRDGMVLPHEQTQQIMSGLDQGGGTDTELLRQILAQLRNQARGGGDV